MFIRVILIVALKRLAHKDERRRSNGQLAEGSGVGFMQVVGINHVGPGPKQGGSRVGDFMAAPDIKNIHKLLVESDRYIAQQHALPLLILGGGLYITGEFDVAIELDKCHGLTGLVEHR